jgi:hypothetical protein
MFRMTSEKSPSWASLFRWTLPPFQSRKVCILQILRTKAGLLLVLSSRFSSLMDICQRQLHISRSTQERASSTGGVHFFGSSFCKKRGCSKKLIGFVQKIHGKNGGSQITTLKNTLFLASQKPFARTASQDLTGTCSVLPILLSR